MNQIAVIIWESLVLILFCVNHSNTFKYLICVNTSFSSSFLGESMRSTNTNMTLSKSVHVRQKYFFISDQSFSLVWTNIFVYILSHVIYFYGLHQLIFGLVSDVNFCKFFILGTVTYRKLYSLMIVNGENL